MFRGRQTKLLVGATALLFVLTVSIGAFADATSGSIFVNSENSDSKLVLHLSDNSDLILDTTFNALNDCAGFCAAGGKAPNQGFWTADDVNFDDNSSYRAGITTTGIHYRDYFTFDLTQFNKAGVSVTGVSLEVQRHDSTDTGTPDHMIGWGLGVVPGTDSNGDPITGERINNKSNDTDAALILEAIHNGTPKTFFEVNTADPSANANDILSFQLDSLVSVLNDHLTNDPVVNGHKWFSLGGETFDVDSFTGQLIDPTVIPPVTNQVPEPASLIMLGSGLAGMYFRRKK